MKTEPCHRNGPETGHPHAPPTASAPSADSVPLASSVRSAPQRPFLPRVAYVLCVLFPLAFAAGCATHRESLERYHAAEALPFHQRTLEWLEKAEAAPPLETPRADTLEFLADLPEPLALEIAIAARVFDVSTDSLAPRLEALKTGDALDAALGGRLDLHDLLLAVTLRNPGVQAAREAWHATLHQYTQAEYLEGLLREYRAFGRYLDMGGAPDMDDYLPYPSTLSFKGEMIREEARMAEIEWEQVLRDTLVQAGATFFEYQFQHRGEGVAAENVAILENLLTVVQERFATGLATQAEVLRLQVELERQRNLERDFRARQRSAAADINALLDRSADAPLGRPADRDLPHALPELDALTAQALEHRQEIRAQDARIAQMEIALRMGEIMNRPRPGLAMEAAPRPAYAQSEAYLGEMRQRLEAARRNRGQLQAQTRALARTTLEEADIARRQATLIEEVVLPLDRTAYDIALRGYMAGDLTFMELLDAERQLLDARLELDESRRDRNQALLQLTVVRGYLEGMGG